MLFVRLITRGRARRGPRRRCYLGTGLSYSTPFLQGDLLHLNFPSYVEQRLLSISLSFFLSLCTVIKQFGGVASGEAWQVIVSNALFCGDDIMIIYVFTVGLMERPFEVAAAQWIRVCCGVAERGMT